MGRDDVFRTYGNISLHPTSFPRTLIRMAVLDPCEGHLLKNEIKDLTY